ncbi:MAG: Rieske 2Fe-2S protein [Flaviaesturariibacter sp.]|nr:Rieske 2Fe-2S protein [Flaviaesturariibacter sp.]
MRAWPRLARNSFPSKCHPLCYLRLNQSHKVNDKPRNWVRVAGHIAEIPFGSNNLAEVPAGGRTVLLVKGADGIHAVAPKCPHAGGALVHGWLDGSGNVVCPLHRYRFCPSNGRNVSGEGYYLKRWPVEERADGVYVGLEAGFLSGLFGA